MNKLKETKILGFPLWMYLIFSILMMVMAANDWMLTNMVGALAFAMIIGTLLGWVGDHIPVWKTWFGGGSSVVMGDGGRLCQTLARVGTLACVGTLGA